MHEAESLTPPLSPVGFDLDDLLESEDIDIGGDDEIEANCFTCGQESYLSGGFIRGLLNDSCHQSAYDRKEISLFSYKWPCLSNSNQEKLFLIMRLQIGDLQTTAVKSRLTFVNDASNHGHVVRQHVCSFLQYVLHSVQSGALSDKDVEVLVSGLLTAILHMGRLSELPHHVTQSTSVGNKVTISDHCLHLHLDTYWRILSILHLIQLKYPECRIDSTAYFSPDCSDSTSLFSQVLHTILWDLVFLANVRYISKVNCDDPMKTTMFGCSCVREMWTLILVITDWRSNCHMGESFWISYHHVMKSSLDRDSTAMCMEVDDCRSVINPPEGFKTDDPSGLNLWIMYHLSSLYTQSLPMAADVNWSGKPVSNYHDLETLVKKLLSTPGITESTLRKHLKTCLCLTSNWEPNTRLLITLWDFFYKRLNHNESFQTSRGTLDGLACVDQSIVSIYDRCNHWTQGHLGSLEKETSFQIFLRLLCQHLGKLYRNGSTQEWKQVKGRIYSKFHARRIQELMEGGLYNLTVLFVSLAMTADLEDVASKLCDFYDMLDINSITYAKRSVVWRGAFTLMLVYIHHDMDITYLADRMSSTFANAVSDFEVAGIDTKHCLWKLILIYLEGMEEIVDSSKRLQLSEFKLLCPAIQKLLTICSEQELRTTLCTLHSVIMRFRDVVVRAPKDSVDVKGSLQYAEFTSALWKNVYSFIIDHAQTLTPPPIVADIAASFCLLSLTSPDETSDSKTSFLTVFKHFASAEKVNVSISSNFLSHLLPCDDVMTRLEMDLPNYETFIISIWFRYCLFLPCGSPVLQSITRSVQKLQQFNDLVKQSDLEWHDIDEFPVLFLKALERAHKKIENWQEKMKFQQQIIPYFSDVPKYVGPVLKTMSPVDVVNKVYQMTGYLIKYCAKLIYVRQDAIVPSLISGLLVPFNVLKPDKPISNVFLTAVRRNMYLFLEGIGKLPYDKDPFLQRKLQDILVTYLPKFPLTRSSMNVSSVAKSVHPLVASLNNSCQMNPQTDSIKFRHYMMKLVITCYVAVRNMSVHQNHSLGFSFIDDVVQRTSNADVKAKDLDILLGICLEYLLLLPSTSQVWLTVFNILQDLSQAFSSVSHQHEDLQSSLTSTCQKFVSMYFKYSSSGVLKTVEKVSLLLRDIVMGTIDQITDAIKEIESKRGVGVDNTLRKQYVQVLKLLGDKGTEEIRKLQSDAL